LLARDIHYRRQGDTEAVSIVLHHGDGLPLLWSTFVLVHIIIVIISITTVITIYQDIL
jgi:hypothetical protein